MINLQKFLLYLQEKIKPIKSKYSSINNGGCGAYGLAMYRELKKLGINANIVMLDYPHNIVRLDGKEPYEVSGLLNGCNDLIQLNNNGLQLGHIVIEVPDFEAPSGNWYIDADGVSSDFKFLGCPQFEKCATITEELLDKWVKNPVGWNDWFDRSQISYIEMDLDMVFMEYKQKYNLLAA